MSIFDNKNAYPTGKAALVQEFDLKEKEEEDFAFAGKIEYKFDEFVQIELSEGLYYFVISEKENANIL
ncbi:MAG: hypothetical protein AAF573_15280 [Bacteroidota bacterium]